jgi:hypothetical protein
VSWEAFLPPGCHYDALSARDKVYVRREAERNADEERKRQALHDAAVTQQAERRRAQYAAREQYRGVGAAIAGHLPIHTAVLEESAADATALLSTLQGPELPGSKYGSARAGPAVGMLSPIAESPAAGSRPQSAAGELPSHSRHHALPAAEAAGVDGLYAQGDAGAHGEGGADGGMGEDGYECGELPDTDSEDSVILDAVQGGLVGSDASDDDDGDADTVSTDDGEGDARGGAGAASAASGGQPLVVVSVRGSGHGARAAGALGSDQVASPPRRVTGHAGGSSRSHVPPGASQRHQPQPARKRLGLDSGEADDEDIKTAEEELRAELMRSTMRCNGLRASLEVARKIAVDAGVHMHGGHAAAGGVAGLRASSAAGSSRPVSAALPSVSASIPLSRDPFPPSAGSRARVSDDYYAEGSGTAGGPADERPIRPSRDPAVFGLLPAPRYPVAAAPGTDAPLVSAVRSTVDAPGQAPAPACKTDPHTETLGTAGAESGDAESSETYDEDDIGDEDGDVEGGVSFKHRAGVGAGGDAIPEVDEDADDEDEDDDDEDIYGTRYVTKSFGPQVRGGAESEVGDHTVADYSSTEGKGGLPVATEFKHLHALDAAAFQPHGVHGAVGEASASLQHLHLGPLSERVDKYRRLCLSNLGGPLFERTYHAVKEALFGGDMEQEPGLAEDGDGSADTLTLDGIRASMPADKRSYLHIVEALVNMEEQLL